jgi:hypothetical protein
MHCLDIAEYKEILLVEFYKKKHSEDLAYIHQIFEACKYWDNKIIGINYFLSIAFENIAKNEKLSNEIIDFIYELSGTMNFEIEEIDADFINKLYENFTSSLTTSLFDELIDIQKKIHG